MCSFRFVVAVLTFVFLSVSAGYAETLTAIDCSTPKDPTASEERSYLCEAIRAIENNSLTIDPGHWPKARAEALTKVGSATNRQQVYSLIKELLAALGDRHSLFLEPEDVTKFQAPSPQFDRVSVGSPSGIARVEVRGFRGGARASIDSYIRTLRAGLAEAKSKNSCAYIVDLRNNPGGNMWPTLLGLQPLLGWGKVMGFRGRDGKTAFVELSPGGSAIDGAAMLDYAIGTEIAISLSDVPVAVLIGPTTASSGEAVAIAFKGRPGTLFFGSPTRGKTTANSPHRLSGSATIYLTEYEFVDRNGGRYPMDVKPESEAVIDEEALPAAEAWIASEGACKSAKR